jgi:hypothetical protein
VASLTVSRVRLARKVARQRSDDFRDCADAVSRSGDDDDWWQIFRERGVKFHMMPVPSAFSLA